MEGNLLITLLPTIVVALPTLIALVAADVRFCQPGGDLRGGKRSHSDQSKEERVHCWFDQSSNDPFASLSMSFCFLETRCRRNISPTSLSVGFPQEDLFAWSLAFLDSQLIKHCAMS